MPILFNVISLKQGWQDPYKQDQQIIHKRALNVTLIVTKPLKVKKVSNILTKYVLCESVAKLLKFLYK